jgi:hypothetical protein
MYKRAINIIKSTVTPRIYKPAECNDTASQLDIKTKKNFIRMR